MSPLNLLIHHIFSMKQILKLLFSAIGLLFALSSCSNVDDSFLNEMTLILKDRIVIPIDAETKRDSRKIGFIENFNSIYLFNEINYQIYFISLDSQAVWKKVQLHKEGPDGIGEVTKIKILSPDSIFVLNRLNNQLYFIDGNGRLIDKRKILFRDEGDPIIQLLSPSIDFISGQNKLLIPVVPIERTSKDKAASLLTVNIETGERQYIGSWPDDFRRWGRKGSTSYGTYNMVENKYVFSHSFSEEIQVWNLNSNEIKSFYAGSKRAKKPVYYRGNGSMGSVLSHQVSNAWFENIYYDRHNKVYLRGVSIGLNIPDPQKPTVVSGTVNGDKISSVAIILDNNHKKIQYKKSEKYFSIQSAPIISVWRNNQWLMNDVSK